jgi:hypothetical protein
LGSFVDEEYCRVDPVRTWELCNIAFGQALAQQRSDHGLTTGHMPLPSSRMRSQRVPSRTAKASQGSMARYFSSAQTAEKWVALPLRPPEKPVHLKHSSSLSQSRPTLFGNRSAGRLLVWGGS